VDCHFVIKAKGWIVFTEMRLAKCLAEEKEINTSDMQVTSAANWIGDGANILFR
jgi:hypothetical protein